ncbi:MAG: hypothetical protein HQ521_18700, partial [Bacteroidetes bacterium]|nr:hypothetical protein [Bacteroidota bacterium]
DDHIYCDPIVELLINGTREMEQNPDLLWTRFSGYPLIYDGRGNLSKKNDRITFDSVVLNSLKRETYTLWFSNLQSDVNKGRYWPVAMWFSIFRLPILRKILILSLKNNCKHLGNVEDYFKNKNGFKWLSLTYPEGSFGYINMQFGGFEMHRNHNWKTLIDLDNNKIL